MPHHAVRCMWSWQRPRSVAPGCVLSRPDSGRDYPLLSRRRHGQSRCRQQPGTVRRKNRQNRRRLLRKRGGGCCCRRCREAPARRRRPASGVLPKVAPAGRAAQQGPPHITLITHHSPAHPTVGQQCAQQYSSGPKGGLPA